MTKRLIHIIAIFISIAYAGKAQTPDCPCGDIIKKFIGEGEEKRFISLKTNLLYDAVAIPNIDVEISVGENVTFSLGWAYAWWSNDRRHRYWRVSQGSVSANYWFGKNTWTGHHIGSYAQMLTYDFELGGDGVQAGKWSYAVGVKYGYSIPLNASLNLDCSLGIGYLSGRYSSYGYRCGKYMVNSTQRHHYVGLTQLEVSLVWLLGKKNH